MTIDRQAAHVAERALVGMVLDDPSSLPTVDVDPAHFSHPGWRMAWEVFLSMHERGVPITYETAEAALEARGHVAVDLIDAAANSGVSAIAGSYAEIVREGYVTREVMVALDTVRLRRSDGKSGTELLDEALAELSKIRVSKSDQALTSRELLREWYADQLEMSDRVERGETVSGLATGIEALDRVLGGMQPGIVTVAAGRPGMGKSSLALALTDGLTAAGHGVHVFSLEDHRRAYVGRMIARTARVSSDSIRRCVYTKDELRRIGVAKDELASRRGWLVDDGGPHTPESIVRSYRQHAQGNGTRCVIVDYVQLVRGERRLETRERIDHAMETFSLAAKRDDVAFVVLSQLNRKCEYRDDKRPLLSDLRESGGIEQNAKCVLMMYRHHVYDESAPDDEVEIHVRKNNFGSCGAVRAKWHGPTTRIY